MSRNFTTTKARLDVFQYSSDLGACINVNAENHLILWILLLKTTTSLEFEVDKI